MKGSDAVELARAALVYGWWCQVRDDIRRQRDQAVKANGIRKPRGTGRFNESSVIVMSEHGEYLDKRLRKAADKCGGAKRSMMAIARRLIRDGAPGVPLQSAVDWCLGP